MRAAINRRPDDLVIQKLKVFRAESIEKPGIRHMKDVAKDPDVFMAGETAVWLRQLRGNADNALSALVVVLQAGILKDIVPDGDILTASRFVPGADISCYANGSPGGMEDISFNQNFFCVVTSRPLALQGPKSLWLQISSALLEILSREKLEQLCK